MLASKSSGEKTAQLIRLILEQGGKVNAQSEGGDGLTALHEAASANNVEAVKALLEGGADIEVKDGMLKRTALIMAIRKEHGQVVAILEKEAAGV